MFPFSDVPHALQPHIDFEEPNVPVVFYEGVFRIQSGIYTQDIYDGKIEFAWIPKPNVRFTGTLNKFGSEEANTLLRSYVEVVIENKVIGQGLIMKSEAPSEWKTKFVGVFWGRVLLGDERTKVDRIVFSIPNHYEFLGDVVKTNSNIGRYRLKFETDDHEVIIDKHPKYSQYKNKLISLGGYHILCTGEIRCKTGQSFKQVTQLCRGLRYFISFVNGQRMALLFIFGFKGEELQWRDYTNFYPASFQPVENWGTKRELTDLSEAWTTFLTLWMSPDDRNFLTYAIRWYVEANTKFGFPEQGLILAQTALELIFNWWLVENKKIIQRSKAKSLSAEDKICLILLNCNISADLPPYLVNEFKRWNHTDTYRNAAHFIVDIRNAIVHSNQEKRKRVFELSFELLESALHLSLWYVEMALLRILNHNGLYYDRNIGVRSHGSDHDRLVPWIFKEAKDD